MEEYDEESEEFQWFSELDNYARTNPRILTEIYYGAELIYSPDDYDQYVKDFGELVNEVVSESEFRKMMDIESVWTPIDEIIPAVEEILRLFP